MKDGEDVAVMETSAGKILIRFFPNKAPETVKNWIKLAESKFYDGTKFHRTIPGFMIQGGDPNTKDGPQQTWGTGGPGYTIKDELNDIAHEPGILSMAHAGPNTGGSQFFIMVGVAPHLNNVHTAFGEVVEGMNVVDKIVATPTSDQNGTVQADMVKTIKSVKIVKWPAKE
jgi:cyclophilin family peptidyl-prolyl cis-trans isomerase